MRKIIQFSLISLLVIAIFGVVGVSAQANSNAANNKKIDAFFKASKRTITSPNPGVWAFKSDGRQYFFATEGDILVGGVVMFAAGQISDTTGNYTALLKMNHRYDFVKITIDDDGDVALRFDTPISTLDKKTFDRLIDQLIKASREILSEFE